MAENEKPQATSENKPVKKRRFFRPRPKKAGEEGAVKDNAQQSKPQQSPKPKTQPKPQVAKAVKAEQKPKQPAKPKQAPVKPAAKTAHALKTNGNFRPRRPKEAPKLHLSDIDFKYLNIPEFADIYALVTKAQSYFETDKETCCAKFRIANEAIIARLIETLQLKEAADKNTFEQINMLSEKIPADMVNSNIFSEMHNIRMIGNSFVHNDDKYDATKGAKTCLIAMEKICQWLVEFEPKYKSYQRAKAATSSTFMESVANIFKGFLSIFKGK